MCGLGKIKHRSAQEEKRENEEDGETLTIHTSGRVPFSIFHFPFSGS
jgi:hypothetical protein